jgi:hypothetical protein
MINAMFFYLRVVIVFLKKDIFGTCVVDFTVELSN